MVNEPPVNVIAMAHIAVAINRDRIVQILLKTGTVPSGGTSLWTVELSLTQICCYNGYT